MTTHQFKVKYMDSKLNVIDCFTSKTHANARNFQEHPPLRGRRHGTHYSIRIKEKAIPYFYVKSAHKFIMHRIYET